MDERSTKIDTRKLSHGFTSRGRHSPRFTALVAPKGTRADRPSVAGPAFREIRVRSGAPNRRSVPRCCSLLGRVSGQTGCGSVPREVLCDPSSVPTRIYHWTLSLAVFPWRAAAL
jgi:hypothetical protein